MNASNQTQVPSVVAELSRSLTILAVRLTDCSSEFHAESFTPGEAEPKIDNLGIDITTGGTRAAQPQPALISQIALTLRLMGGTKKLATLKGTWVVVYQASKETLETVSDDLAIAFNTFAGPRPLWPFAREFFANLCWRMQLPPVMLPPYDPAIFPDFLKRATEAVNRHELSLKQSKAQH